MINSRKSWVTPISTRQKASSGYRQILRVLVWGLAAGRGVPTVLGSDCFRTLTNVSWLIVPAMSMTSFFLWLFSDATTLKIWGLLRWMDPTAISVHGQQPDWSVIFKCTKKKNENHLHFFLSFLPSGMEMFATGESKVFEIFSLIPLNYRRKSWW